MDWDWDEGLCKNNAAPELFSESDEEIVFDDIACEGQDERGEGYQSTRAMDTGGSVSMPQALTMQPSQDNGNVYINF